MSTPWYTSSDIISSVKRKIMIPISQNTFSDTDILAFANEEMLVSQIPAVLQFHEEYFVYSEETPLVASQNKYPIPSRAIGMRLRDIMWKDSSGNLFEMTRIDASDKAFFQRNVGANTAIHKFYLENNSVVLTPSVQSNPTGTLVFYFFMRPNMLVTTDRAATIQHFHKRVTVTNASILAGDTFSIDDLTFTAVSGSPSTNEFQIGASSIATATNLAAAINTNGTYSASSGSPSTNVVELTLDSFDHDFTSTGSGLSIVSGGSIHFDSIPSNIVNSSKIDFLQTLPGHKIIDYSVQLGAAAISTDVITFNEGEIPLELVVGDYICLENECIIPQIPTDLHSGLAERTAARILAALGDQQGLAMANQKIAELAVKEGMLVDDRVEGAPKKINARHSILRYTKMGTKRRF